MDTAPAIGFAGFLESSVLQLLVAPANMSPIRLDYADILPVQNVESEAFYIAELVKKRYDRNKVLTAGSAGQQEKLDAVLDNLK